MLQHKQSGKLLNDVRDAVARARQAFENESNGGGAVVGQLNLRHRDATTAFASEDGVMFKHGLGYVSLSNLGAHNRSSIARSDLFDNTRGGNSRDYRARILFYAYEGGQGECRLF